MSIILYIETNLILQLIKGQDQNSQSFLENLDPNVKILMPSICYMEALVAFEKYTQKCKDFQKDLDNEITELNRSILAQHQSVKDSLEQTRIDYGRFSNELEERFVKILELLNTKIELIYPETDTLLKTFNEPILQQAKERRDDFILQIILKHGKENINIDKSFLSDNKRQFNQPEVTNKFKEIGIRYFTKIQDFCNYLYSKN